MTIPRRWWIACVAFVSAAIVMTVTAVTAGMAFLVPFIVFWCFVCCCAPWMAGEG